MAVRALSGLFCGQAWDREQWDASWQICHASCCMSRWQRISPLQLLADLTLPSKIPGPLRRPATGAADEVQAGVWLEQMQTPKAPARSGCPRCSWGGPGSHRARCLPSSVWTGLPSSPAAGSGLSSMSCHIHATKQAAAWVLLAEPGLRTCTEQAYHDQPKPGGRSRHSLGFSAWLCCRTPA